MTSWSIRRTCAVCGRRFILAPAAVNSMGHMRICSWKCLSEAWTALTPDDIEAVQATKCKTCDGRGRITGGDPKRTPVFVCDDCNGTGSIPDDIEAVSG